MTDNLDFHFLQWLEELSKKHNLTVDQLAQVLAINEIKNRVSIYPDLEKILTCKEFDLKKLGKITQKCWASGSHYQDIRFQTVLRNGRNAESSIKKFANNFPAEDNPAIKRIDNFIDELIDLGFTNEEGNRDLAGAAGISSVFLTALFPQRFVDFLPTRWKTFSEMLEYPTKFPINASYGEKIVWAGKFASDLSNTSTFKKFWPQYHPLWIVASLCWKWQDPYVAKIELLDIDPSISVEEGKKKIRSHLSRERSPFLMAIVKTQRKQEDPLLKCDVCKFSFIERYGDLGEDFIEGHHIIPLASLEEGQRTKPEDIALVCSNCHRMIHRNGNCRSIESMQKLLQ